VTPVQNPIIPGFHPDPSICRVGQDYYVAVSTFEYFPGVPIFHSRDLRNWKLIGHCLTRESQLDLKNIGCSGGIYAPTLRHHNGTFYMVTTNVGKCGNFYVTASDPAGPWSEPILLKQRGIDPSFLFDDDGKVYLTTSQNLQSEIDIRTGELLTEPRQIWEGTGGYDLEAPHLYKINGWYYLLCAEGGTHHGHMITLARSRSPWGPFTPCPHNPILTNRNLSSFRVQATGHGDLVEAHDGTWWLVCLAIRTGKTWFPKTHHLGRETFLAPVHWDAEGWPVVNGTGTLDLQVPGPGIEEHAWPVRPARQDFSELSPDWVHIRNPEPHHYSLEERPTWLRLRGAQGTLIETKPIACIVRRQTETDCEASTLLEFSPERDGDEAGLVVLMNREYHYCLHISRQNGRVIAGLRRQVGDITHQQTLIDLPPGACQFELRLKADAKHYHFALALPGEPELAMGSALVRLLTTEVAGGFTGMMIGLYATGNGHDSAAPTDFAWFEYVARRTDT
jgi:xylan 1,4-beta-xylosidase